MPNTTNFNWATPADTDLVKDGAAAIRTLGNSIDSSFVDLKGGTTGQILSKASNTDLDFTWTAGGDITEVQAGVGISVASGTGPIPVITNSSTDLITTAGDLLYGTAADTVARLGIGTAGQVLRVNSGATAPEWGAAASGFAGAEITHSGNTQTIANNTWTKVTFDSEIYDVGGYAASGSTITIPSGKGGYYLVIGWAYFDQNATGTRQAKIYKNGSPTYLSRGWASNATVFPQVGIQNVVAASATNTLEFYVFQSSGGNLTLYVDADDAGFSVAYLGA